MDKEKMLKILNDALAQKHACRNDSDIEGVEPGRSSPGDDLQRARAVSDLTRDGRTGYLAAGEGNAITLERETSIGTWLPIGQLTGVLCSRWIVAPEGRRSR